MINEKLELRLKDDFTLKLKITKKIVMNPPYILYKMKINKLKVLIVTQMIYKSVK